MQGEAAGPRLEEARAAFERGDWLEARRVYESVLEDDPRCAEALDGLGETLWFLCEIEEGVDLREQAYAEFRRRRDVCRAADIALWLAVDHASGSGDTAVANGWFRRAERLLEDEPLCPALVELEVGRGRRAAGPDQAERHFRRALDLARRLADADLEIRALTQLGTLRISVGDVDEGMNLLDECVAAAMGGELRDPWHIGGACCTLLAACDQVYDFERAAQWCREITDFMERRRYTPLFFWCRAIYGGVLVRAGQWADAEHELLASLAAYGGAGRPWAAFPLTRLADLRLRQGRIEEAAQLVAGHEDDPRVAPTALAVLVERGDVELAGERLERRLESVPDGARAAPLLPLLARVRLARADIAGARDAVDRLLDLARQLGRQSLVGAAELTAAEVSSAAGDGAAVAHLDVALEIFARLGMPLEEAQARLLLAREYAARDAADASVAEARSALATFERLGALRDADAAAALLRSLGAAGRSGPRGIGELTQREREVLDLLGRGLSNPEIAERLFISPKTAEHHVSRILRKLDLRGRQEAAAYAVRQAAAGPGTR